MWHIVDASSLQWAPGCARCTPESCDLFHVGFLQRTGNTLRWIDGSTFWRWVTSPFDNPLMRYFRVPVPASIAPTALLLKTPSHRISAKTARIIIRAHRNSIQATCLYLPPYSPPLYLPLFLPPIPPSSPPPPSSDTNTPSSQPPPSQPPSPARKTPSTPSTALSPLQTTPHCGGSAPL